MAPNGEVAGLRTALAMGAARAVLVSDEALAGSDSLSTAKVIAKAVERAGDVDLVLTATESTDGYTGTIPAQVAELLGWPSLTFAKHVEVGDGKVTIQRQTEAGYDVVEASLPAVVSVTAGVVEPRYPSFKGIMAAKNKPVDQVTVGDLGLERRPGRVGGRPADRSCRSAPRPSGRPARRSRTTARRTRASSRSSSSSKSSERLVHLTRESPSRESRNTRWRFRRSGCSPRPTATSRRRRRSSCSPRHASSAARSRRCYVGANADALAAGLGEHGATTVYAVDPGDVLPGIVGAAALDDARSASTRPTSCCSRRATTAATRSPACR